MNRSKQILLTKLKKRLSYLSHTSIDKSCDDVWFVDDFKQHPTIQITQNCLPRKYFKIVKAFCRTLSLPAIILAYVCNSCQALNSWFRKIVFIQHGWRSDLRSSPHAVSQPPYRPVAQTYSHVTLGSSFTAEGNNSFWAAPSGEFTFGSQQFRTGGFLPAIWFNKIPEMTMLKSSSCNYLMKRES